MHDRLGIWFEVRGDARFLSHRDMMRVMERAAARAELPMKFSQGFNPRPKLSLPLPRPVGIASQTELLVLELSEPVDPAAALDRLRSQLPPGVTPTGAALLEPGKAPQPRWAEYGLDLDETRAADVERRVAALADQPTWPWQRESHNAPRNLEPMDLRPLVAALALSGRSLRFRLIPRDQSWARVDEVLALVGLDDPADRAGVVRLAVSWEGAPDRPPPSSATE